MSKHRNLLLTLISARIPLLIVGTDDVIVPTANSLVIAGKIPGAWLVQIKGAGHFLMHQYPEQFSSFDEHFFQQLSIIS